MINVTNLTKRYGARALFEDVDLRFDPGKRYGIVGANGAGKSTLLRLITGAETADGGQINIPSRLKLGTLTQDHFGFEDVSIVDVVIRGRKALADALIEKEEVLADPDAPAERIAELEEIIADNDGYIAESRIGDMLEGLGIPVEKHQQPMRVLSGGYKLRVLLAQCLFSDPEVLLLDEPTNHLDIYSIRWLEDYLIQFKGVLLVVSHDRGFLNSICTHMADIDYGTIKIYTGNYDQFLEARQIEADMRAHEASKAEKRMGELQQFVTRFKAKATKARQAQSKAKMIERMAKDMAEPVYSSRVFPAIRFEPRRPPGRRVLEVRDLAKSFGEKQVLRNVSFDIYRNDKIAIIGPNGVGKSTLLKILVDNLAADSGSFQWGHETYPVYFSQDHHESIDTSTTVYEWLYQWAPGESIGAIRGTLGNVLFSGDDVHKSTQALSGGEAARLVIAKLMLLKGNILILDEPTNHLDMESIESLVGALESFDGTVLLVSHNRYVVDRIATKVLEIKPNGIDLFDGTYGEFLDKVAVDHLAYQVDLRSKKNSPKKKPVDFRKEKEKKRAAAQKRKQFQAEARPLLDENQQLEGKISALEDQIAAVNDLFSDPNYFTKAKPEQIREQDQNKRKLEGQLSELMAAWERVSLELEGLKEKYGVT